MLSFTVSVGFRFMLPFFFLYFLLCPRGGNRKQTSMPRLHQAFGLMLKVYLVIFIWCLLHREHIFLVCIY